MQGDFAVQILHIKKWYNGKSKSVTIFEDVILHEKLTSRDFKTAVLAVRRALGDEFDQWYESIRGLSYSDEVQHHEKEEAIRREMQRELMMMRDRALMEHEIEAARRRAEETKSEEP